MSYPVIVPNWDVYSGDTFSQTYSIVDSATQTPINLSAWTNWRAWWRPYQGATVVEMTVSTSNLSTGQFTIVATPAQTVLMDGPGQWDVESVNGSVVRTWLRGKTNFTQDVTV